MPETPTIALTAEQLQTVRKILRRHIPDAAVWAYGSRVKGTATDKSDLDMVAFGNVEKQIQSLREDFDESSLPFRVDIFAWNRIPEQFRENIKQTYYIVQNGIE